MSSNLPLQSRSKAGCLNVDFRVVFSLRRKGNPSSPFHYGSVRDISEEGRDNGRKPKRTELWSLVGEQTASRMPVLTGGSRSTRETVSSPARQ